jgi:hypothetical protein
MVEESAFRQVRAIQRGANVVLTGGALVQLLSRGMFLTADVDLALVGGESEERAEAALRGLGFVKRRAYWMDRAGENLFQIVGRYYDPEDTVERIRAVCLEYLVADRLQKCSNGEVKMCEQALFLLREFGGELDTPYLKELLRRFGVDESFLRKSKLLRLSRAER